MAKVNLESTFEIFLEAAKIHVPESDIPEMVNDIIREMVDNGINMKVLYGNDEDINNALDDIYGDNHDDMDDDGPLFGEDY